jgi:hypothetical protein
MSAAFRAIHAAPLSDARLEELDKTFEVCRLVVADSDPFSVGGQQRVLYSSACQVLDAALYAVKTTCNDPTHQRVFIQDFAASLNRRRLLTNKDVEPFWKAAEIKIKLPQ